MGVDETKVWRITCDRCRRAEGPVFADHRPSRPAGWEYETLHDCGLTGYTRHDLLCPECVEKKVRRDAASTKERAA